uniref:Secreted protein n=1 Tax=Trichogramma kaykai TaxID=54128 RepID=A0ABD2XNH7_9HYME
MSPPDSPSLCVCMCVCVCVCVADLGLCAQGPTHAGRPEKKDQGGSSSSSSSSYVVKIYRAYSTKAPLGNSSIHLMNRTR